ncbi:response regulator [Azospirillum sp.]|uniref:response regulator n=1 Tax=Azospirillum sp. TaxID=34012 RepID=UPI002D5144EB|nr:response regulator [Azospirillum sp.]HYD65381.1 response regulator [Azospirillum sp.]
MKELGGTPRALKRLLIAAVVAPAVLACALGWQGYAQAQHEAEAVADRSARVLADHLRALLQIHVFATSRAASRLTAGSPDRPPTPDALNAMLVRFVSDSPELSALTVIDPDGRPIASSVDRVQPDLSFADRAYFKALRDGGPPTLIARPVTDRVTGVTILPFARRIQGADGAFGGIVLSALPVAPLVDFFRTLGESGGRSVTVARGDGTVLLREPETTTGVAAMERDSGFMRTVAASPRGGTYRTTSVLDGVERLHVVRPVGGHDVYVSAGIETSAILVTWLRNTGPLVGLTLLAGLALAVTAGVALRRARGELAAYAELRAEVQRREVAEFALRQSQKLEAVGQLTGGIAHDFNNHLQVIGANLQLLRGRALDGDALSLVGNALAGVDRAATLAARLLAFARRQPLSPTVVNLGRVVQTMTDLLRRTLGESIEIETIVAGGLWNTSVDLSQLENAILNLAVNARDAMQGRGKLTIEAGNAELDEAYAARHAEVTAGQYVLVAVSDTGAGMPPDVLERVFEPFFTTKPAGEGTGLGLSMIHGFVKQSGGHVKIYSEVGQGTTVKIYLPRVKATEQEQHARTAEVRGGTERVLVVEDDPDVRAAAVALVRSLGYRTIEATNAESALNLLESGARADLLFTDVVMPGSINTRDFARRAQEVCPDLRVLFTSGYTANAIVHHGRLDEGVSLLSKPYSREALATKLRHVLDAPAQADPGAVAPAPPARLSVLVVEDDALIRLTTLEMLDDLGHHTLEAADAEEALAALAGRAVAGQTVDVLLTDVGLPGMSGSDLADEARRRKPGIAVVMATGYAGFSHPGAATLPKPYSREGLQRALAEAISLTRETAG